MNRCGGNTLETLPKTSVKSRNNTEVIQSADMGYIQTQRQIDWWMDGQLSSCSQTKSQRVQTGENWNEYAIVF